jgi:sigma-B regulation protein RsbU (phosphoserine phosphatase)
MLLRGDGSVERLAGGGPPLALLPGISYAQISIRLEPGDTLVIFSDGIVEPCNLAGEFWEEVEVERVLLSSAAAPLAKVPELLCAAVDNFAAGAEQYDDMTVVAVRIL